MKFIIYFIVAMSFPLMVVAENSIPRDDLEIYLDNLQQYECRNCPDNFDKIDNDGVAVYGVYQFKESTFREQVRKFNLLPNAEYGEIMNMIYDTSFQRKLVRMMLEENPRLISRWKVSVKRGLGLPPNYK